jgi:S-adenosylmethionine/arginine decarboxylase-like enzyme
MPSNDVLKNMIDNLSDKLDDHAKVHETILILIKELQAELRESNGWKNKFMGALGVIFVVVIPIMGWALYEIVNLDTRIQEQLTEALETNFDITPYDESN